MVDGFELFVLIHLLQCIEEVKWLMGLSRWLSQSGLCHFQGLCSISFLLFLTFGTTSVHAQLFFGMLESCIICVFC